MGIESLGTLQNIPHSFNEDLLLPSEKKNDSGRCA